ncbi:MAG: hypothetical protein IKT55_06415 [Clostridia bacterium]|nr:hypothetical protein [Clostridia bacterium]
MSDIVFKTKAFGGYNKKDVMDYINTLLAEKNELNKTIASFVDSNTKLEAEVLEYKTKCEEIGELRSELVSVKALNSELSSQIDVKETEIKNLLSEVSERDDKILKLENTVSENVMSDATEEEIEFLRAEVQKLKAECERSRDMERQVGAAMLDARVHSEELVEAARERANNVTKAVYAAIGDTAVKIDDLSDGIGEIARAFTKSVEEVELRIKALTGDMSKTAQLLIAETGVISDSSRDATGEIEYNFNKDDDTAL